MYLMKTAALSNCLIVYIQFSLQGIFLLLMDSILRVSSGSEGGVGGIS